MESGRYDRRIRIERRTAAKSASFGSTSDVWETVPGYASVPANIQEILPSKAERLEGSMRIAQRPARVRVRYASGITSAMRVVYLDRDNRLMKILTPPVEMGRREALEFMVSDFSTQGAAA